MSKRFIVTEWVCDYTVKDNDDNEIIVLHPIKSVRIAQEICDLLNKDYESGL